MACVPPALKAFCFLPFITTAIDYIVGILVIVDVDLLVSTSGCSVHYYYSLLTLTSILGYFVVTFSSFFFFLYYCLFLWLGSHVTQQPQLDLGQVPPSVQVPVPNSFHLNLCHCLFKREQLNRRSNFLFEIIRCQ